MPFLQQRSFWGILNSCCLICLKYFSGLHLKAMLISCTGDLQVVYIVISAIQGENFSSWLVISRKCLNSETDGRDFIFVRICWNYSFSINGMAILYGIHSELTYSLEVIPAAWPDLRKVVFHTLTIKLSTLTIHNFRLVNATDLKFGQQETPTQMDSWKSFSFVCLLITKLWSSKHIRRLGCEWKAPFCKSGPH